MLCRNAWSPICLQGNTWSICLALLTIPFVKQDWHKGCLLNCARLIVRHAGLLYALSLSWLVCSKPPWSRQKLLSLLRRFLHPSSRHTLLYGAYGIVNVFKRPCLDIHSESMGCSSDCLICSCISCFDFSSYISCLHFMLTLNIIQSPFLIAL